MWTYFISFWCTSKNGTVRSYGAYVLFFFLRNWQIVFQIGFIIIHSYQQCMRVHISWHPCPHLSLSVSFDNSHPSGCVVVSHYGLICISLITNDVEHLFIGFWPFVYLFRRNISLNLLSILRLGYLLFFLYFYLNFPFWKDFWDVWQD